MFNLTDKVLSCSDCGQDFTFTASEQEFFTQKGFTNPSRCPSCRAARKAARAGGSSYDSGFGGGSREMHPATCAQCGKETQVPFKPSGDRPVYCSDCFKSRGGSSSSGSSSRGSSRW
jgi:CxxC-x17-CxxC domain-containing protein